MGGDEGHKSLRLELCEDLSSLKDQWQALQERAPCTFYQSYEWCQAWQTTIGKARSVSPAVVAGFNGEDKLVFVLPFGMQKRFGCKVLIWLGTGEMTYGMGIYSPDFLDHYNHTLSFLWPEIIKTAGHPELINLVRQPMNWQDQPNPLGFLFSTRSANQSFTMQLEEKFDELYGRKRSSSTRRGNRKRDRKLLAAGKVMFGLPDSLSHNKQILEKMQSQQAKRLSKRGITGLDAPEIKDFLFALNEFSVENSTAYLLPYHLKVDGRVVAVMLGASFKNSYWALVASLTSAQDLQKLSPGDYALRQTIKALCENGYQHFDFSAGDSEYKRHWSDNDVSLYETIRINNFKAVPLGLLKLIMAMTKRLLKRNRAVFGFISKLRARFFGA